VNDTAVLRAGAADSDGVIYLAWGSGFDDFGSLMAEEARAVGVLIEALSGSGKALVIASGTPPWPGRVSTEEDPMLMEGPIAVRARTAQTVLDSAAHGVRSAVVRLPRSVHGRNPATVTASPACSSGPPGPRESPATSGTAASGGRRSTALTRPTCSAS
jgi:hypothetical protein